MKRIVCFGSAFADRMDAVVAQLGDGFSVDHIAADAPNDAVAAALSGALAMVTVATRDDLPIPRDLPLVQVPGIGWDGVQAAHLPENVPIANVGGHEIAVAEYCLAQMLDWCLQLRAAEAGFRTGSWHRSSRFGAPPHRELRGATVGIIGYGGIGRELARLLKAFGVRVLAANRSAGAIDELVDEGFGLDSVPEMLAACDFAVVAVALTPDTEGLVGMAALDALGADGVLVNVARGPVVDESALHSALAEGRLGGAIIDVWYRYPDHPDAVDRAPSRFDFAALSNVVMTPHVSGWSEGTAERRVAFIAENIRRAAAGEPLANIVARGTRPA
jgi:phosphoglycerate dehydrogenase-like enzyme